MIEFNFKLQDYYKNIFNDIKENVNDYDTLLIAIELLKIASGRLDQDLENEETNEEYKKLINIIKELEEIKDNYI